MASETNELTFVRCPTCRSLVPASASKCRICNAVLDAGPKGASGDAPPAAGGRVRQKTVSAAADEVKNMVAASAPPSAPLRAEPPAAKVSAPVESSTQGSSPGGTEDEIFDPLGAFLQDLDSSGPTSKGAGDSQPKDVEPGFTERFDASSDDDADDDDDDLEDFDLDIFDDPEPIAALEEKPAARGVESGSDEFEVAESPIAQDDFDEPDFEAPPLYEPPPVQSKPVAPVSRPAPQRREVVRPQEPRKPQNREVQNRDPQAPPVRESRAEQPAAPARGSQGPIRPRIGGMPKRPEPKAPQPVERQLPVEPAPEATRVAEPRERSVRPAAAVPQRPVMQPSAPAARAKPETPQQRPQAATAPQRSGELAEGAGARTGKMRPGRLVGWLVSYEHPDGRAIELRAGRFFVTGTSIRPSDLILEDQSISTPHALMAITESGLQIQDLMSERGTFVRPQGEAQYTREEGAVELQHGDWIRFGDVEFLVTLVPA